MKWSDLRTNKIQDFVDTADAKSTPIQTATETKWTRQFGFRLCNRISKLIPSRSSATFFFFFIIKWNPLLSNHVPQSHSCLSVFITHHYDRATVNHRDVRGFLSCGKLLHLAVLLRGTFNCVLDKWFGLALFRNRYSLVLVSFAFCFACLFQNDFYLSFSLFTFHSFILYTFHLTHCVSGSPERECR